MILLKIINTSEISENKVIYSDEIKKIKFKKDRKLAFASQYLKSLVTKKYYSISHSYPYCVICESDRKVGVDIENTNRNIDHQEIYEKKIGGNKKITKLEFLTEWTIREAYYKYSQDTNYLKIQLDKIKKVYDIYRGKLVIDNGGRNGNIQFAICTPELNSADDVKWEMVQIEDIKQKVD